MKKVIISSLVVIMILSVQQIWAQRSSAGKIDHLKTELDLSDDQASQLEKIFESKQEEMMKLRSVDDNSRDEKRQSFHQSMEKEIENVLNEDQLLKFQEIKKQHRGGHGMRGKHMGHHEKFKDGKGAELHNQIKTYKEKNIKPVMLEQRAKLESKISETDKQVIAEFRIEFEKMKTERQARFEEMKKMRESEDAEDFKRIHKERKAFDDNDKREIMKSLVEKYRDDIEPLFAEVADQQEKWKKDIKAIVKNTLDLEEDEMQHGMKRMKRFHGERSETMKMSRFLLLDPNEEIGTTNNQILVSKITAYPNPANTVTTIEYDVLEEGMVLIELRNNKGELLKTVKNEIHEIGKHSVMISLDAYDSDLFYIVIKDKNGLGTTKNIVRVR